MTGNEAVFATLEVFGVFLHTGTAGAGRDFVTIVVHTAELPSEEVVEPPGLADVLAATLEAPQLAGTGVLPWVS